LAEFNENFSIEISKTGKGGADFMSDNNDSLHIEKKKKIKSPKITGRLEEQAFLSELSSESSGQKKTFQDKQLYTEKSEKNEILNEEINKSLKKIVGNLYLRYATRKKESNIEEEENTQNKQISKIELGVIENQVMNQEIQNIFWSLNSSKESQLITHNINEMVALVGSNIKMDVVDRHQNEKMNNESFIENQFQVCNSDPTFSSGIQSSLSEFKPSSFLEESNLYKSPDEMVSKKKLKEKERAAAKYKRKKEKKIGRKLEMKSLEQYYIEKTKEEIDFIIDIKKVCFCHSVSENLPENNRFEFVFEHVDIFFGDSKEEPKTIQYEIKDEKEFLRYNELFLGKNKENK